MTDDTEPISTLEIIGDPELLATLEGRLTDGDLSTAIQSVDGVDLLLPGSQGCFVFRLETGEVVVVKRSDQTVHGVALGPEGEAWVKNEAAAYELARILGFQDIVLPTKLRMAELADGTKITVAVRLYVEASEEGSLVEGAPLFPVDNDQLARAAIFDWLIEQTDRRVIGDHGGNWYVLSEPGWGPRLLLFDHQQCFGTREGFGLASGIWEIAGHKIGPYLGAVQELIDSSDAHAMLREYLTEAQLADLLSRAEQLLA